MLVSRTVDLNGLAISYGDSETPGPEVVFLHGYPSMWEDYQPFLEELAAGFHVYAPSMRGMGRSGRLRQLRRGIPPGAHSRGRHHGRPAR